VACAYICIMAPQFTLTTLGQWPLTFALVLTAILLVIAVIAGWRWASSRRLPLTAWLRARNGVTYELRKKAVRIGGTARGNDVVIPESTISRRHAVIEFRNGEFLLRDLQGRNGTFVNGSKLASGSKVVLRSGDRVRFDAYEFVFSFESTTYRRGEQGEHPVSERELRCEVEVVERPANEVVDSVHFSVTAPEVVVPASTFELYVWAHLDEQRHQVLQRAMMAMSGETPMIKGRGPSALARGTVVQVKLRLEDDLIIENDEDEFLWAGEIASTCFLIHVLPGALAGPRKALVLFRVQGLQFARLSFLLNVGPDRIATTLLPCQTEEVRKAFASYASPVRIPMMSISHSDLMPIRSEAKRRRALLV
jgi:FHA domain